MSTLNEDTLAVAVRSLRFVAGFGAATAPVCELITGMLTTVLPTIFRSPTVLDEIGFPAIVADHCTFVARPSRHCHSPLRLRRCPKYTRATAPS